MGRGKSREGARREEDGLPAHRVQPLRARVSQAARRGAARRARDGWAAGAAATARARFGT
jgi:hypothetical protein